MVVYMLGVVLVVVYDPMNVYSNVYSMCRILVSLICFQTTLELKDRLLADLYESPFLI